MSWIALRMLTAERGKYLGIIFGVAFAALLMSHQVSMFWALMRRTTSPIPDVRDADLWVMDPAVKYMDEPRPLPPTDLHRVRGVPGVAWAVRFHKGVVRARTGDGTFRQAALLGFDDDTLVGVPREMVLGELDDLRRPDAVFVDAAGYQFLWPGEPCRLGKILELSDRRAVLVGVCKALPPFQSLPVVYTRFSLAARFAPPERNMMSYVLARCEPGTSRQEVCRRIREQTGLQALTGDEFARKTVGYYLRATGIGVNFGITVALGFIVGVAIAGQTFYLFTVENLKQFGALKAMGVTNARIVRMVLLQALVVGLIGYAIGIGLSGLFFHLSKDVPYMAGFFLPAEVMAGTFVAVLGVVLLASVLSVRRVLVLEPAVVFRV
jgi:putative ABC transport system permease protein